MPANEDLDPTSLAEEAEDKLWFTFLFLRLVNGRWLRDVKQIKVPAGIRDKRDFAIAEFWLDKDRSRLLFSAVIQGEVCTVDGYQFGDEPNFGGPYDDEYRKYETRAEADSSLLSNYTVFGVWDTGEGFKRDSRHVRAIDPLHAELIVRTMTQTGEYLVAAVVELHVNVRDFPEFEIYASEDGTTPPKLASSMPTRRFGPWGVAGIAITAFAAVMVLMIALL